MAKRAVRPNGQDPAPPEPPKTAGEAPPEPVENLDIIRAESKAYRSLAQIEFWQRQLQEDNAAVQRAYQAAGAAAPPPLKASAPSTGKPSRADRRRAAKELARQAATP